jgi:hypothetical protein
MVRNRPRKAGLIARRPHKDVSLTHNRRNARMDWLCKHRPSRFQLQRLSNISRSNDIACMSKIYTIFILLIIIEIPKVKVNMRLFFLSVYVHVLKVNFINSYQNERLSPSYIALSFDGIGSISWFFVFYRLFHSFYNFTDFQLFCPEHH